MQWRSRDHSSTAAGLSGPRSFALERAQCNFVGLTMFKTNELGAWNSRGNPSSPPRLGENFSDAKPRNPLKKRYVLRGSRTCRHADRRVLSGPKFGQHYKTTDHLQNKSDHQPCGGGGRSSTLRASRRSASATHAATRAARTAATTTELQAASFGQRQWVVKIGYATPPKGPRGNCVPKHACVVLEHALSKSMHLPRVL